MKRESGSIRILMLVGAAITALGVALWTAIVLYYPDLEDRAAFGNLFGGINALFAAWGFAAIAYTLHLQQRALEHQRQAAVDQQNQLAEQERRIAQQTFEATFFRLMQLHGDILARTIIKSGHTALQAFDIMVSELRAHADAARDQKRMAPVSVQVEATYAPLHASHRGALDHYFRNLYHIVKFVDESAPTNARRYTSIIRAQLSAHELMILMYNGASPAGEKFKPLIEKYALLEHLPDQMLGYPGDKLVYHPSAFGR